MTQRELALVEVLFQRHAVDARFAGACEVDLVDLENAVEGAHVDNELARLWTQRATDSASATERGDHHLMSGRPAKDRRHLVAA